MLLGSQVAKIPIDSIFLELLYLFKIIASTYVVKTANGREWVRNHRFIRKRVPTSLPIFENCFDSPDSCDSEPYAKSNNRPESS